MGSNFKYDICVAGGAGHVGLPLSIALAAKGKKVIIYDINEEVLGKISSGEMPFLEKGADDILKKVTGKNLFTSSSAQSVAESKIIIVIIGTPVDEHLNPQFNNIRRFFDGIADYLSSRHTVILRSTVYPGTSKKLYDMLDERYPGIGLSFCPERIAEGRAMEELHSLPQIISGFTPEAVRASAELFNMLTPDVIVTNPLEAELTKLFSNSWRYIQFATANQFYMIAEEFGADFYEVYDAMTYNYPRTRDFPRPGFAAGPCLFKDTMQISSFAQNKFFLGHSAMLVNEGLPNFIVDMIKRKMDISDKTVAIFGMAFKAESDDSRESLSYKLRKILEFEAARVLCTDVYIKDPSFVDEQSAARESDIIIIGAPHKRYRDMDFGSKTVFDIWNFVGTV